MRKAKKTIAIGLSLAMMVSGIVMPSTESQAASKVKLNKTVATITVGKKLTLKVKRTKKKVKWASSKKAIASVTKKGVVTGKKVGKATITAKVGKKKYKCKVTVKAKAKKTTAAKKTTTKVTPTPNGNVVNVTETAKPVESVKPVESMESEETAKPEESVKPTQNPETEGLIKAENIKGDYYVYDSDMMALIGKKTKKKYAFGDKITIRVVRADKDKSEIDFEVYDEKEKQINNKKKQK